MTIWFGLIFKELFMKTFSTLKNVPGVPDNYFGLIFGQQIEYHYKIADYTKTAKQIHLSQKHQSYKKAIREFIALYRPINYYIPPFGIDEFYYDDSFIVYYNN